MKNLKVMTLVIKASMLMALVAILSSCGVGFQVVQPLEETPEPLLSCSVSQEANGALITCPDGSEVFVPNGTDGQDGVDGIDGLFVGYVDPCGEETRHDELLYLDRNGNYHAWFANVGHVILLEGVNYVTTDGTSCRFTITNGDIIEL